MSNISYCLTILLLLPGIAARSMAQEDAQGDSLRGMANICHDAPTDTVGLSERKESVFKQVLRFIDKTLAPPRDTNYIEVQKYNWCAEVQVSTLLENYEIDASDGMTLKVSPEARTRVGPLFGWRWMFLGYNFDLRSVFITSKETDLGGSIYTPVFGVDLFYRRVGGLYNIREFKADGIDFSDYMEGVPFDGITTSTKRINAYYVCNYKRYSHQAAFSQTNRQIRSAGSAIFGFSYAHNKHKIDYSKLSDVVAEYTGISYQPEKLTETISTNEYCLTGGYAYNWVFAKNWLLAGEASISLGYLSHHADVAKDSESDDILKQIDSFYRRNIALNGTGRFAVLWNNGPLFTGSRFLIYQFQHGNGNIMTRNTLAYLYVYAGVNF